MAARLISSQVTMTSTPALIATGMVGVSQVTMHCDNAVKVYIGAADVSTTTGLEIHTGDTLTIHLPEGVKLYGVVQSGSHDLTILHTGGA